MNINIFFKTVCRFICLLCTRTSYIYTFACHCDSNGMRKAYLHKRTKCIWERKWTKMGVVNTFKIYMPVFHPGEFKI